MVTWNYRGARGGVFQWLRRHPEHRKTFGANVAQLKGRAEALPSEDEVKEPGVSTLQKWRLGRRGQKVLAVQTGIRRPCDSQWLPLQPAGGSCSKFNHNMRKSVSRMVHSETGACRALGKLRPEQSKRRLGGVPSGKIPERKVDQSNGSQSWLPVRTTRELWKPPPPAVPRNK